MPEIILFTVSIDSLQEQGTELNPEIENVLPELRKRIETELQFSVSDLYQYALD
jgi:hypothetical protein